MLATLGNKAEAERFEATEHEDIADNVKLKYYGLGEGPKFENANEKVLKFGCFAEAQNLDVRLFLTFAQIIALAGDFFGISSQPITNEDETQLGNITEERRGRFIEAYNTIAQWSNNVLVENSFKTDLMNFLNTIRKERKKIEKVAGQKVEKNGVIGYHDNRDLINGVYEKHSYKLFKEADRKSGGYWIGPIPKRFGRLLSLCETNYDHFQPYAKVAFEVGLELAFKEAVKARSKNTPNEKNHVLDNAYSILAFACHFLTDAFSSGHIRTPRRKLPNETPRSKTGHLLTNKMHDEDNKYGLRVTSQIAQNEEPENASWIAYGDKMLQHTLNGRNLKYARRAVQQAADEVFAASKNESQGWEAAMSNSKVFNFIPEIDASDPSKNNTPMFQTRPDGKVCRRKNLRDLQCKEPMMENWNGEKTLAQLKIYKPRNFVNHSRREEMENDE